MREKSRRQNDDSQQNVCNTKYSNEAYIFSRAFRLFRWQPGSPAGLFQILDYIRFDFDPRNSETVFLPVLDTFLSINFWVQENLGRLYWALETPRVPWDDACAFFYHAQNNQNRVLDARERWFAYIANPKFQSWAHNYFQSLFGFIWLANSPTSVSRKIRRRVDSGLQIERLHRVL